jgi:hypothetical protein
MKYYPHSVSMAGSSPDVDGRSTESAAKLSDSDGPVDCKAAEKGVKPPKESWQLWTRNKEQQIILEYIRVVLV